MISENDAAGIYQYCGRALLYFEKDSVSDQIDYGDKLVVTSHLNRIGNPGNPGEFDYKSYMLRMGIGLRGFVKSGNWELTEFRSGNKLIGWMYDYRSFIIGCLQESHMKKQEYSVAAAILLGYDEILDPEMRDAFSRVGAMHILCVSGLHVGIVFMVLNYLLAFLKKMKHGNVFRAMIIILLIWFYAGITGFSPSVLRASTMFTFLAVGKMLNRQAFVYNTLAASAFLILLIDPLAMFKIGFQLSYAAVFFIVWLHPPIYRLIYIKNTLLDKAWSLTCVSITATLGTFPLVVHYFHQFPVYFVLTNLIVIPLSFMIVSTGVVLLLLSFIKPFSWLLTFGLKYLMMALNYSVIFIEKLPGSAITGIYFSAFETLLLYLLIFLVAGLLINRNFAMLKYSALLVLFFVASLTHSHVNQLRRHEIVIYNVNKGLALDLIHGYAHYFVADSATINDEILLDFNVRENWIKNGLAKPKRINLDQAGREFKAGSFYLKKNLILFCNRKILVVNRKYRPAEPDSLQLDIIILHDDTRVDIQEIYNKHQPEIIILSAGNNFYKNLRWKQAAEEHQIPVHDLRDEGAWIRRLE